MGFFFEYILVIINEFTIYLSSFPREMTGSFNITQYI